MIRLIATDLDNTLLQADHSIYPETLDYLKRCYNSGIKIVIATGRHYLSAQKYAKQIGDEVLVISYNGALIADANDHTFFSENLTVDTMRKVAEYCKSRNIYCQFYENHKFLVEDLSLEAGIDPDIYNTKVIKVGDFSSYDLKPSPKALIILEANIASSVEGDLRELLKESADVVMSQADYVEVIPKGINKGIALSKIASKLNIDPSEVLAFGDNHNDIEMISWAGIGVSVANGVEKLKNTAKWVTEEEKSKGVLEGLRKFVNL